MPGKKLDCVYLNYKTLHAISSEVLVMGVTILVWKASKTDKDPALIKSQ